MTAFQDNPTNPVTRDGPPDMPFEAPRIDYAAERAKEAAFQAEQDRLFAVKAAQKPARLPNPDLLELGGDDRTGTGIRIQWIGNWPPPETVVCEGITYRRVSFSTLPLSPHIVRGAKYLAEGHGNE